jgi:hypothetical protein
MKQLAYSLTFYAMVLCALMGAFMLSLDVFCLSIMTGLILLNLIGGENE